MKRKLFGIQLFSLLLVALIGLLTLISSNKVMALEDTKVDLSTLSYPADYTGGSVIAPYDGIAVVTNVTQTGEKFEITLPVETSKSIAIEMRNFTKNGVTIYVSLQGEEETYALTNESVSNTILKSNNKVVETTGNSIALNTSGTAAGGYNAFNGYVVIQNTNAITSVTISIPLDAAEKVFIGKVYEVSETLVKDATYDVTSGKVLYTPNASNYTATKTEQVGTKFLLKNELAVFGTCKDQWEENRIDLPNLSDGKFTLSNYKYFVLDVDFSNRTAATSTNVAFFRNNGDKWNADRLMFKEIYCIGEDGTNTKLISTGIGQSISIPAGFKGQVYFKIDTNNMFFGTNWKDDTVYSGTVFKQMMIYLLVGRNEANVGKVNKVSAYFTNSNALEIGETNAYAVATKVNKAERGTVIVDTTEGITVTPVANEGYQVKNVLVNGNEVQLQENKLSFSSLTENKNVVVNFVGTTPITFNNDIENVTITTESTTIYNGDSATFKITAAEGYSIKSVIANGEKVNLDVNGNVTFDEINENIMFSVEIQKVGENKADSSNIVLVSDYFGGTLWMPFDGITVFSKAAGQAGDTASITIPVNTSKNIAIRVNNYNRSENTKLSIVLKKGDTEYTLSDESVYYVTKNDNVTSKTGATVVLGGSGTAANGYYGFNGYVIIPNTNEIDSIVITADLTVSTKFFIGNVYELDTIGSTYTPNEAKKLYTPSSTNYTKVADEKLVYVAYLEKESYVVVGPHTGNDGWEQSRVLFDCVEENGTIDLTKYTYLVFDVDFSNTKKQTNISCTFFRQEGPKYNADRAQPKTIIGVGDDGSYFTSTLNGIGGSWYVPQGFKGKLYFSVNPDNMFYGTNFKESDSKTSLFKEFMLYALCQGNQGNVGVVNKLSVYLSNVTLPEYEAKTINLTLTDDKKGTASISTYKQVLKGSNVTVTVNPRAGYLIDKVLVNNEEVTVVDGTYTIENVTEDTTIVVSFTNDPTYPKYQYTITKDEHVNVNCEVDEIAFGTDCKFTFVVDFGYSIKSVKVNGDVVTLTDNAYTVTAVEADVTIEVETEVIPELTDSEYTTNLGKSQGSSLYAVNHLNNFYADFDSILVSSILYSRETAKEICPQPYVGINIKGLSNTNFDAIDAVIIQYRQYHTQTASASGTGIKVNLVDTNGKNAGATSGGKVYLVENTCADGSTAIAISTAYISGGMIFVPANFSGYLVIPKATFTVKDGFDMTSISHVCIYDDYRWWSDSGSRYAIGNLYTASLSAELAISNMSKIWDIATGEYEEYLNAMNGSDKPYTENVVTFSQFAFTQRLTKGNLYFFDYSKDFSKYANKGISFELSKDMEKSGYYDFRTVKAIRLMVDNTGNQAINFNIVLSANGVEWTLNNLAKVVFYDTTKGEAEYGSSQIPAGFKGYIDIYFEEKAFSTTGEDATFPSWFDSTVKLSLPECSEAGIKNGTHLPFDVKVLMNSYNIEYTTIVAKTFNINYVLNGGTNSTLNGATYKAMEKVTLSPATKEGYEFQGWYLTSDFTGTPITEFENTSGDITLYAKFGAHFTVTYNVTGEGQVNPRKTEVEAGDTLTLLLFPDDGYEIASVKVNGKPVALDENDSFKIEDIQENITIEVVFIEEEIDEPDKKTTAKKTENKTNVITTENKDDIVNKAKSLIGCNSSISFVMIPTLIVSVLGLIVTKKRKEE